MAQHTGDVALDNFSELVDMNLGLDIKMKDQRDSV